MTSTVMVLVVSPGAKVSVPEVGHVVVVGGRGAAVGGGVVDSHSLVVRGRQANGEGDERRAGVALP